MSDGESADQASKDRVEAQVRALKAQQRIREIHQRELGWAASNVSLGKPEDDAPSIIRLER